MARSIKSKRNRFMTLIAFIAASVLLVSSFQLTNQYLYARDFDQITVHLGENATEIAARYTTDAADQEELVEAIITVNDLRPDGALRSGQTLKIPLLPKEEKTVADGSAKFENGAN